MEAVAYYLFNLIISLIKNKRIKNASLMLRLTGAYNGSLLTRILEPDMPEEDISLATYKYVGLFCLARTLAFQFPQRQIII